jgi:hypothetical protein
MMTVVGPVLHWKKFNIVISMGVAWTARYQSGQATAHAQQAVAVEIEAAHKQL